MWSVTVKRRSQRTKEMECWNEAQLECWSHGVLELMENRMG